MASLEIVSHEKQKIAAQAEVDENLRTASTSAPAIELDNVSKRVRGLLLDGISLRVGPGKTHAVFGREKAGKTMLLRMIAALDRPDSGRILAAGIDVMQEPTLARSLVAYAPQHFDSNPGLTVREYLDFYIRIQSLPGQDRAQLREELLELVDLTDQEQELVDTLRQGQKQLLSLARSLIRDPEVLLLDEPAAGLSSEEMAEMSDMITDLGALGKTILISSIGPQHLPAVWSEASTLDNGELRPCTAS